MTIRVRLAGGLITCEPGDRLLDAIDASGENLLNFGCRDASCGSCLLAVSAGEGALAAPAADERRLLQALRADARHRLGCQVCIAEDAASGTEVELQACAPLAQT